MNESTGGRGIARGPSAHPGGRCLLSAFIRLPRLIRHETASVAPPPGMVAGDRRRPTASSTATGPPLTSARACGGALRRISCATPTPSSLPARACRSTSSSASSGTPTSHQHLPARHRHRGDHRHRARSAGADDVRHCSSDRRLTNGGAAVGGPATPCGSDRFALRKRASRPFAADRPARLLLVHLESLSFDRPRTRSRANPIVTRGWAGRR